MFIDVFVLYFSLIQLFIFVINDKLFVLLFPIDIDFAIDNNSLISFSVNFVSLLWLKGFSTSNKNSLYFWVFKTSSINSSSGKVLDNFSFSLK
ncbi:hypothetical protein ONA02_05390 [Mycoplasmopsis felis]|uniref:hypothetical protein n=1 Tax=Mycoplasmopsis felis TaxID=33923 RepID=UPI002285C7EC|nr:hypothetical protein [Mycoplasmopsis felis]WAM02024.1 hypothetical protein ONA02_05390 [Mycoplasmopsis felis]